LTLRDASGQPLPQSLVTFTLDKGSEVRLAVNGSGTAALPDLSIVHLDATRPWAPGSPSITARDALDVLRMAVGVAPSFGPATAQHFIAADINRDGKVTALDALEVLRAAVGVPSANAPSWVFLDPGQNLDHISAGNVSYQTGLTMPDFSSHSDLDMTGILLGHMGLAT